MEVDKKKSGLKSASAGPIVSRERGGGKRLERVG